LEDRQVIGLPGQLRDQLDPRRTGPDDADALAGEVDVLLRPPGGVVPVAGEVLEAREVRAVDERQAPGGGDQEPGRGRPSVIGGDDPARARLVVAGRGDRGVELDVTAQVEAVGDMVEVPQQLRLGRIALGPVPLLLELLVE
jgi:hypothetical protein